ncbi:potassium channel family protein [Microbacterium sp. ASV49]|uniref:Potassium channel family protein n=1 Tax=Microbacterium candidum TaxID=3041922 RepID=A0ABT7MTE7_9MICO|nr:potassium channel family protein [Microbacterium sp. ASV49]MDL9977714.1 potassium channel family protein [Microbacterium sp. ASV49]
MTSSQGAAADEDRPRPTFDAILLVSSIVFIAAYSWLVIGDLQGPQETVALTGMAVAWVLLAIDYLTRLFRAKSRGAWFRRHLFELVVVVLPPLRVLHLLGALAIVGRGVRDSASALRRSIAWYGVLSAIILMWACSVTVLAAERGAPGANIETFGEASWWSVVTFTTVGYGDYYPVTTLGHWVAVVLMFGSIAVIGLISGTLVSWITDRAKAAESTRAEPQPEPAPAEDETRAEIRRMADELAALTAEVRRR